MEKLYKKGLNLLLRCLTASFVSMFFMVLLGSVFMNHPKIFSTITTIVLVVLLYVSAWEQGHFDKFSKTGIKPSFKRAFIMSQIPASAGYVLFLLTLIKPFKNAGITIFKLWFAPYNQFIVENLDIAKMLICVFSIPLICIISYYIGASGFSFLDHFGESKIKKEQRQKEELERKKEERREYRRKHNL